MNKLFGRSFLLVITFFAISLFSLLTIYTVEKSVNVKIGQDKFISDKAVKFNCKKNDPKKQIQISKILLDLDNDYIVLKESNGVLDYKSLFFNTELKNEPEMLEGRFFDKKDFMCDKKYAVVGKNCLDNITEENGEKYYFIENDYYEVIGIMGNEKKETSYDDSIYVNLDSLLVKDSCFLEGNFIIDGKNESDKLFNNIEKEYKKIGIQASKIRNTGVLSDILKMEISETTKNIFEVVSILIINILLITKYWINKQKKEFGVRRINGSTKGRIALRIICKLLLISTISYLSGYVTFIIISYISDGYFCFYPLATSIVYLIAIISALVASIIPIVKANKMQISEVIK